MQLLGRHLPSLFPSRVRYGQLAGRNDNAPHPDFIEEAHTGSERTRVASKAMLLSNGRELISMRVIALRRTQDGHELGARVAPVAKCLK